MKRRKKEHVDICLNEKVEHGGNGFQKYYFIHNALPEVNFSKIDISTTFLNKKISAPFIISPISCDKANQNIIKNLAVAANRINIVMSLGSQRIYIENPDLAIDFNIRKYCGNVPLLANLGAVQLNFGFGIRECRKIVECVNSDALVLHLNPLQEAIQPEGQTNFKDLFGKIKNLVKNLYVPVIVKEVGCGISKDAALRLKQAGVEIIDVAGHGGTNWALIEGARAKNTLGNIFCEWGIPTAESIIQCRDLDLKLIAGGGIRSGLDAAKAIALGADYASIGLPLLSPAALSENEVVKVLEKFIHELKIAMFCIGATNIKELKNNPALKAK